MSPTTPPAPPRAVGRDARQFVLELAPDVRAAAAGADGAGPRGARYLGSKARVADAILDLVGAPTGGWFVDGFAGTGAVARAAASRGWPVRLNDHLRCATAIAAANTTARGDVPFAAFGGYAAAIDALNRAPATRGFIWREYSPASSGHAGVPRRYFTELNAARIDGMRAILGEWAVAGLVSPAEFHLLLADLLHAADRVANTAGTYGCFLRTWMPNAEQPVRVNTRALLAASVPVQVHTGDVHAVPIAAGDVAYFDPPYTKRQYAAYYHVLETIAAGDAPAVAGVTGLRPWRDKASVFCYRSRALRGLVDLIAQTTARRVYLSYSADGHVPLDALVPALAQLGHVQVHTVGLIGRYRPNRTAQAGRERVAEHVIEVRPPRTRSVSAGGTP